MARDEDAARTTSRRRRRPCSAPTATAASATRRRASCPCRRRPRAAPCRRSASWSAARATPSEGREVFFKAGATSCAGCHRVQGRGRWVGPDLSTIGTKYGKDELLRSILNPSAAIGYNYRSAVVALNDGRVVTGLTVEDAADRLVLKTAEGERVVVKAADIEDRKVSDVSLMPEGLAQSMTDGELVDLLAFLRRSEAAGEHRRPVPGDRPPVGAEGPPRPST